MSELHLPLLKLSIVIPLLGGALVSRMRNASLARGWSVACCALTFLCTIAIWLDFVWLNEPRALDRWHWMSILFGHEILVVDQLSAPLFSLGALLYFVTSLATLRSRVPRFSFTSMLWSESVLLATFSCSDCWGIVALLAVGTLHPYFELQSRGKPHFVFMIHMALFVALLFVGQLLAGWATVTPSILPWAVAALCGAVLIRSGVMPFHSWMSELFEYGTYCTSLLFTTPLVGAYAAVRLVLPIASESSLRGLGLVSLATAVVAAGLTLVQKDVRRFFCYLLLSHSALVLVGLASVNPLSLTGALCVWLSTSLALGGLGLTLRALESRCGRVAMNGYQGLYEHTPTLATFFMITGLASIGFPGTFGFVGTELLVDGAVEWSPLIGVAVVIAAMLSGIAVVRVFFLLFTGTQFPAAVSLKIRPRERFAVLALSALILIGGLFPHPNIAARHSASIELLAERKRSQSNQFVQLVEQSHNQFTK